MNHGSSTRRQVRGVQNQLVKLDHHNHNPQVSNTRYIEKVFTNVRQKLNRPEGDQMLDQRANVLIWRLFLCQQRWKLWYIRDTITMRIWLLTGTPISKSSRRCSTSRRSWVWTRSTRLWMFPRLSCNLLLAWNMLCYITKHSSGESEGACLFRLSSLFGKDAWTTGGQAKVERSASIFPGVRHTTLQILKEIEEIMTGLQTIPEEFEDRIIFMSMFNDIDWTQKGNYKECFSNFDKVKDFEKKISVGTWSFLGPGEKEKWHGTHYYKPEGQWNTTAGVMVADFKDSGHPVFRASSALDRRFLKKKGGRCTIRFSAEPSDAELLFRTIHSANQLSIYGAIADWCDELIDSANTWSIISQHGEIRSCVENWSLRKWIRWYEHLGRLFKQRGIDCASIKKDLKSYQER